MTKTTSGFTIVELLVVIVVIAILATISVVAYNGIQDRAKSSQMMTALTTYEKALHHYKAIHGTYPLTNDLPSPAVYACLSNTNPKTPLDNNTCFISSGVAIGQTSSNTNTALLTVMTSMPTTNNFFSAPSSNVASNGIQYVGTNDTAMLMYMMAGNQQCAKGTRSLIAGPPQFTRCTLTINS